jgi:hypothetical protein
MEHNLNLSSISNLNKNSQKWKTLLKMVNQIYEQSAINKPPCQKIANKLKKLTINIIFMV